MRAPSALTVYSQVDSRRFRLFGHVFDVPVVATKRIVDTGDVWECDNGYEKTLQPVYIDTQGREYRRVVTVDYFNNVSYVMDMGTGRSRHFSPRPPRRAYDLLGNALTEDTPPLDVVTLYGKPARRP